MAVTANRSVAPVSSPASFGAEEPLCSTAVLFRVNLQSVLTGVVVASSQSYGVEDSAAASPLWRPFKFVLSFGRP